MCTTKLPFGRFVEIFIFFSKIDRMSIQWATNLPNCHLTDYTQMEPELFRMHPTVRSLFFRHILVSVKVIPKQSIPVGCVLPTSVPTTRYQWWGGYVSSNDHQMLLAGRWVCSEGDHVIYSMMHVMLPTPMDRQMPLKTLPSHNYCYRQ